MELFTFKYQQTINDLFYINSNDNISLNYNTSMFDIGIYSDEFSNNSNYSETIVDIGELILIGNPNIELNLDAMLYNSANDNVNILLV